MDTCNCHIEMLHKRLEQQMKEDPLRNNCRVFAQQHKLLGLELGQASRANTPTLTDSKWQGSLTGQVRPLPLHLNSAGR